jgi:predicted dehydrogenase
VTTPVRVAVIGAGSVAQVAHLPVLRRLPGVEVAAICDNDAGKAQALAARFEVREHYDDIEEVLRHARPDVVTICTPNHLHEIHVIAALAAGAHVLAERPLALSVEGIERVLAASEKAGRRVMVGMNHRFRSDVQAVRGFLAGGDIGAIQAVRGGWYTFQPSRPLLGWRLRRQQAGGGALLDLGLPLLDLGLWMSGWPLGPFARPGRRSDRIDGDRPRRVRKRRVDLARRELVAHRGRGAVLVRDRRDQGHGGDQSAAGVQGVPRHRHGSHAHGRERPRNAVRPVVPGRVDVLPGRDPR